MKELISQGAEALIYKTTYGEANLPCIEKHRPSKAYRHPVLDAKLTKARLNAESRILHRCAKNGIKVPLVYRCSGQSIFLEFIEGTTVRNSLLAAPDTLASSDMMEAIGASIGQLHAIDVIHGDLTTSNMFWRDGQIVLIDFGLASVSGTVEDKAVDLYVLERAFFSTHPNSEPLFSQVLSSYAVSSASSHLVLKRLEKVRQRGRKRSMVG